MLDNKKPTIIIYYDANCEGKIKEIKAGIEEEGLFCESYNKTIVDVDLIAYEASQKSILGIGIGLIENKVVVQINIMKKYQPLFKFDSNNIDLRIIGCNCARYIKGLAFKDI